MTVRRWKKLDPASAARRERLFAGRVPGEALTKEQHDELVAKKGRPLTQDPIGAHPHPQPKGES